MPDEIVLSGNPPEAVEAALVGRTVTNVGRRGKFWWLELDGDGTDGVRSPGDERMDPRGGHRRQAPPLARQGAARGRGGEAALPEADDPRGRAARAWPSPTRGALRGSGSGESPGTDKQVRRLGPDAYEGLPPAKELVARLAKRKAPIKAVLLDQTAFAGVGNWIADEVLYQAKIAPKRLASSLTEKEVGDAPQDPPRRARPRREGGRRLRALPRHLAFPPPLGRRPRGRAGAGAGDRARDGRRTDHGVGAGAPEVEAFGLRRRGRHPRARRGARAAVSSGRPRAPGRTARGGKDDARARPSWRRWATEGPVRSPTFNLLQAFETIAARAPRRSLPRRERGRARAWRTTSTRHVVLVEWPDRLARRSESIGASRSPLRERDDVAWVARPFSPTPNPSPSSDASEP